MSHREALETQLEAMACRPEHRALMELCRSLASEVDAALAFDDALWREYRIALKTLGDEVGDGGLADDFIDALRGSVRNTEDTGA